ncbi:vWA domain-containing protein [Robertkochia solimangrovi]|uniref:vWA domain-containing protein n=1 Tax=Robertkochia solimangrovi TaxID=2213046 RepID=UPI00117C98B4|nr:VWA domain-containing protein [Robertkochia solimangrovi]TRZ46218.1 hypothetical protein DMZ48_02885 [Robertkochia solimangrovi]
MKTLCITFCWLLFTGLLPTTMLNAQTVTGIVTAASDGNPLPGAVVLEIGTNNSVQTDFDGKYSIILTSKNPKLSFSYLGFQQQTVKVKDLKVINIILQEDTQALREVVVLGYTTQKKIAITGSVTMVDSQNLSIRPPSDYYNTEGYTTIQENDFREVSKNPLSTFSVDVDRAAYSNIRRFINGGDLPPIDAVRIEEMINYFSYDYKEPSRDEPFSINTELSECPWNTKNMLLHIGLQGKKIETEDLPPSNIVFLIDVSGSMESPNKLPLLKSSFKLLIETLRPQDKVAMVVYAGNSGLVLPATPCNEKRTILDALDALNAGGSTAGGAGLELAYKVAGENFIKGGNNRIILATDGDFNVGPSSNAAMERLVESNRDKGIAISVLGFGMGNYKDDKAEIIADKGNGNYAYIDNLLEAKKVLVSEFGGTLFTIAKDVKFQLEFNPAVVSGYRLIGYENRLLNEEDFDDDTKDAGEIGAGHTVTALYEIIPGPAQGKSDLKYQQSDLTANALKGKEIVTLKLRYKEPDGNKSKLLEEVVKNDPESLKKTSDNFRFSAGVASFGMLLRSSKYLEDLTWEKAIQLASDSKGEDEDGYKGEMIRLMKSASLLQLTASNE